MPLSSQTNQTQNEGNRPTQTLNPTFKNTGITVVWRSNVNVVTSGTTISLGEAELSEELMENCLVSLSWLCWQWQSMSFSPPHPPLTNRCTLARPTISHWADNFLTVLVRAGYRCLYSNIIISRPNECSKLQTVSPASCLAYLGIIVLIVEGVPNKTEI